MQDTTVEKPTSPFTEAQYLALKDWYAENGKLLRYIATIAFFAIGFTVTLLGVKSGAVELDATSARILRFAWGFLAASALFTGLSAAFSYFWLDMINRLHMPQLIGPLFSAPGSLPRARRFSRTAVWFSFSGALALATGVGLVICFALARMAVGS